MNLQDLHNGQTLTVRHGRDVGGDSTEPNWSGWHPAILYLVRREIPLPKRFGSRANAPNVGDIITLAVSGWDAEYGQIDYCGNGQFVAEDYYLEIKELM